MQKTHHKPALLIIDMQNDFANPSTRLFVPRASEVLPIINELTAIAREVGQPVVWVIQQHRHQLIDFGRESDISPIHCVEGSSGAELLDGLVVDKDDYFVIKRRYSGFYCTDLDLLLRSLGCDTVILTGIATDGCVQATALDAQARDYYLRVVCDATATFNDAGRDAALEAMLHMQPGVVIDKIEAIKQLKAG
jgi:nicotinamidase-related amidase